MKKLLVVVDFQRDFVDGSLGFPQAPTLDAVIAEKIAAYRLAGDDILFTLDTHGQDYPHTQEGRNLPVAHCTKGTPGWELYGAVGQSVSAKDTRIEKPAFGSMELARHLELLQYTSVEFVGLVTNICVLANAVIAKAALPEAVITVDAAAVASYDERLHNAALDVMEALQIEVQNRR
ncbi:MAG: hypothetical protein DDT20_01904 [Firmicutes bacterium]|nr:hypothetical protein [Bacillota bacterium]